MKYSIACVLFALLSQMFLGISIAEARSWTECTRNARVGNRLVIVGDDAGRVQTVFSRSRSFKRQRLTSRRGVWRREGRRARTIRIDFRDGVVDRICQSDH